MCILNIRNSKGTCIEKGKMKDSLLTRKQVLVCVNFYVCKKLV